MCANEIITIKFMISLKIPLMTIGKQTKHQEKASKILEVQVT